MKNKSLKIFLLTSLLLSACGGGGGGGSSGNTPSPGGNTGTNPDGGGIAVSQLSAGNYEGGYHFGLVSPNTSRTATIQILNKGQAATKTLSVSLSSGNFTVDSTTCEGVLASGASCNVVVKYTAPASENLGSSSELNISGASASFKMKVSAMSAAVNGMAGGRVTDVVNSLFNDNPCLDVGTGDCVTVYSQEPDGAWAPEGLAFDLSTTLQVANTLVVAQEKLGFSKELIFPTSGQTGLNLTLNYLEKRSAATPAEEVINYSNKEQIVSDWQRPYPTSGMKVKEIPIFLPLVHQNLHQLKDGTTASSFSEANNFLENSLKLDGSVTSPLAYFFKLFDVNYWSYLSPTGDTNYVRSNHETFIRLGMRDYYLTMKLLKQYGKTDMLKTLGEFYPSLFNTPNFASLKSSTGVTASYSATPFSHTSFKMADLKNFDEVGSSSVSAGLLRVSTCREAAQTLLNFGYAYSEAGMSEAKKQEIIPVIYSIRQNLIGNYVENPFEYLDDPSKPKSGRYHEARSDQAQISSEQAACLPLLTLALANAPKVLIPLSAGTQIPLVSVDEVNYYLSKLIRTVDEGRYLILPPGGGSGGNNLIKAELLEAMTKLGSP